MNENGGGSVNARLDRIESILEKTVVLVDQVANESKQLLKAQVVQQAQMERTDERIEKLVSAIGAWIAQQNRPVEER